MEKQWKCRLDFALVGRGCMQLIRKELRGENEQLFRISDRSSIPIERRGAVQVHSRQSVFKGGWPRPDPGQTQRRQLGMVPQRAVQILRLCVFAVFAVSGVSVCNFVPSSSSFVFVCLFSFACSCLLVGSCFALRCSGTRNKDTRLCFNTNNPPAQTSPSSLCLNIIHWFQLSQSADDRCIISMVFIVISSSTTIRAKGHYALSFHLEWLEHQLL